MPKSSDPTPEPKGAIPAVLFLCVHNAGRSQMALGWFNHLAGGQAVAWSGGSEPGDRVNPAAVAAMAEVGIDIGRQYPKPWTDEVVRAADCRRHHGLRRRLPLLPRARYEDWSSMIPMAWASKSCAPYATRSNSVSGSF